MANLPQSALDLAENVPAEDIALAVLRQGIPDVLVISQIAKSQTFPAILVRRLPTFLDFNSDERFVQSVDIAVHTFTEDPDGDRDGAILSEVVRVVLRNAWLHNLYIPGIGSIRYMETLSPARRVPDWATAAGPVQYADLPSNVWRYEARYRLAVRKPLTPPYQLP